MKRFTFVLLTLLGLFAMQTQAQTPAGYAIFGDVPYGYTDLTATINIVGAGSYSDKFVVEEGVLKITGNTSLSTTRVCADESNNIRLQFTSAQTLTWTSNFAIHIKVKKGSSNSNANLHFALCRDGWNSKRLGYFIPQSGISDSEETEIVLKLGDRATTDWSSAGEDQMYGTNMAFSANDIVRFQAQTNDYFEITQIYIDADATVPDPAPVAGDEDAPTSLTLAASNIRDNSVTLTASSEDEAASISYSFYYKAEGDADFTPVAGAVAAASGANAVKVVTGLAPETNYSFKVVATDPSSNSAEYTISNITTEPLYEVRYYFFRGDPATVSLPSEGITSHDLRKGQTPGTNITANRVSLEEKKYYTHFQYVSENWFSFDQSLKSTQDLSEITQADWYLVVKFRTTFSSNSFNIRLNNAGECWQVSQTGEKGQLPIDQTGNWNTLTLPLSTALKTLNFTSSMSGNVLQFHSNSTSSGMYLDIAYAYLTNNATSVDDLADNIVPAISSIVDGDKTTSSVVLTVTASDDSGEDLTYIVKENDAVLTSTPATGASGAATDITVSELVGQNHTLTVIARDGTGNEASQNIAVSLPAAVAPPSNLVVTTSNTDKSVTFTMSAEDDNASLVYAILDGSDNVLEDNIAGTAGVETVYTLHGLTPETAYSFKVRVTNAASLSTTSDAINITTNALSEHRFYLTRGDNTDPLPESSNLTSNYVDCNVEFGNASRDMRITDYVSAQTQNTWISITLKPKATVANEIDDDWYIVVRMRANLSNNVFGFNNFRLNLSNNAQNWYIDNNDSDKEFGHDYYDGTWIVIKKRIGDRRAGTTVPSPYLQAGQVAVQLHVNANLIAGEFLDIDYAYFTNDISDIDAGTQTRKRIALKDAEDNESVLSANNSQAVDMDLTRPLANESYNTLCLPFNLSAEQVEALFGAGTKIGKLHDARMKAGDELYLDFEFVHAIEAGVPYIIQPANAITAPMFLENVTISNTTQNSEFEKVHFVGVFNPTEISEQSAESHTILLLGANNQLSWPNTTANMKGMRAYFQTTSAIAHVARRAYFGFNETQTTTGIGEVQESQQAVKVLRDGRVLIIRNNEVYDIFGVRIQ